MNVVPTTAVLLLIEMNHMEGKCTLKIALQIGSQVENPWGLGGNCRKFEINIFMKTIYNITIPRLYNLQTK